LRTLPAPRCTMRWSCTNVISLVICIRPDRAAYSPGWRSDTTRVAARGVEPCPLLLLRRHHTQPLSHGLCLADSHDASHPGSAAPPRAGAREGSADVLAATLGMVEVAAACLAPKPALSSC
jgi:hypothetical protein